LNRLPEVRSFIREDLKFFPNVEFKPIPGHNPDLVLLDASDAEIERIDLSPLNREECNQLLVRKGFERRQPEETPAAEEQRADL